MTNTTRESILREIAEEEARCAALDAERGRSRQRLDELRRVLSLEPPLTLAGATRWPVNHSHPSSSLTPTDKVDLFRRMFRGRDDVYPRFWSNSRSGKTGYAPACANEWIRGVCDKPRVKCGECPNQAFRSFDDRAVLDHLQGRHVLGVYPMMRDETCWFLAADFDKSNWREDVGAFAATCKELGIPVSVERSRSGNGAHVWFFFADPVPASAARRMACHLITRTMARRHELSMDSYDRLFPNQDTMPNGGFGNLIALPLQLEARQLGNTVFVDESFDAYADQWAYLSSVSRMPVSEVLALAGEAARSGTIIGVRSIDFDAEGETSPWSSPPSRKRTSEVIAEPLPKAVHAVLAQRIFVEKQGVPSALLNEIKRLAAFENPEFYKKQGMRLSTALTPRVISCAEESAIHIGLPRGCLQDLESLLSDCGVQLKTADERVVGAPLDVQFEGRLTAAQEEGSKALLGHDVGVFVAPPGSGKTVVGINLIAKRGRNTLVVVHRQPLLEQWVTQLSVFLGLDPKEIGRIGAGKRKPTGALDVAMLQSLMRQGKVADLVADYGHIVVDECHHVPAVSFERVLSEAKAKYVTGLTATPQRRDGHHPIIEMQMGPALFQARLQPGDAAPFRRRLLVRETAFGGHQYEGDAAVRIQELYGALAGDEARNRQIMDDVLCALEEGRSPVLLTERRDHLEWFYAQSEGFAKNRVVLRGGMGAKQRRQVAQQLEAIPASEERLVLATGRYIGEGFDDARLDTLFLTLPVSWKGTLIQYAGRLHRNRPGKHEVRIYDYVDRRVPMLARMFEKRRRGYRAMGYVASTREANNEVARRDEPVVEWDAEHLAHPW